MYVVAIAELASGGGAGAYRESAGPEASRAAGEAIGREAVALAADLGTTAYEERLNLAAGLPAIILTTPDLERARALLARVRARGHVALACDSAQVVPSTAMVELKRFRFADDALVQEDPAGERLPWSDVLALLRATHRTRTETQGAVAEKRFALGRALATGGLVLSKTVTHSTANAAQEQEPVLYLFRRSGGPPWLLRESGTHYTALGAAMAATSLPNFLATIDELRRRAPGATFDERLATLRKVPERIVLAVSGGTRTAALSSDGGVDLLAHLIAQRIAGR